MGQHDGTISACNAASAAIYEEIEESIEFLVASHEVTVAREDMNRENAGETGAIFHSKTDEQAAADILSIEEIKERILEYIKEKVPLMAKLQGDFYHE